MERLTELESKGGTRRMHKAVEMAEGVRFELTIGY
jgi:hypothetical protein